MANKKNDKFKILICDPLDDVGLAVLKSEGAFQLEEAIKASPADLKKAIRTVDAAIVRSGTQLTADILNESQALKIVGRAGVGVDNVDVDAASRKGIIVVNTPSGNTISAAEHTFSLMLCLARNIADAHESMRRGVWDRKKFTGVELFEKTLGLVGLGRIGGEVAKRAQSFAMTVLAYDPFLSPEKAKEIGVTLVTLDELFRRSDFISLHVPLTDQTRNVIDEKAISKMKKGVRIVNCARGGLIDESAALVGLESGKIAGIAVDVFPKEPPDPSKFLEHPKVLKTPHLGASTEEAQLKVSIDIAKTVADYLLGRGVRNAVNLPSVDPETQRQMEPYCLLAERMGLLAAALSEGQFQRIEVSLCGAAKDFPQAQIVASCLKGLLSPILADGVNVVNAPFLAKERGIQVKVAASSESTGFSNLLEVRVVAAKSDRMVAGTLFGPQDPRIVRIGETRLESIARGRLLFVENSDVPGMIGRIGTILGDGKINIADMSVGRDKTAKRARILIGVDSTVSKEVLTQLRKTRHILDAKFVSFESVE